MTTTRHAGCRSTGKGNTVATHGGYTSAKLEWRAAKRGRTLDLQIAHDTRSSAQRKRDKTGRAYIAPPEAKPKSAPAPAAAGKKKR